MSQSLFANVSLEDYLGTRSPADDVSIEEAVLEAELEAVQLGSQGARAFIAATRCTVLSAGMESFEGELDGTTVSVIEFSIESLLDGITDIDLVALEEEVEAAVAEKGPGIWARVKGAVKASWGAVVSYLKKMGSWFAKHAGSFADWSQKAMSALRNRRSEIVKMLEGQSVTVDFYPPIDDKITDPKRNGVAIVGANKVSYDAASGEVTVGESGASKSARTFDKTSATAVLEDLNKLMETRFKEMNAVRSDVEKVGKAENGEERSEAQELEAKEAYLKAKYMSEAVIKVMKLRVEYTKALYSAISAQLKADRKAK